MLMSRLQDAVYTLMKEMDPFKMWKCENVKMFGKDSNRYIFYL
jgi:hypothetical protein